MEFTGGSATLLGTHLQEDEATGIVVPDGFRLQELRSAALYNNFVKHGVFARLGMGWFRNLIFPKRWADKMSPTTACIFEPTIVCVS